MELNELQKRALQVARQYDRINEKEKGLAWNEQQIFQGFVGDVGDLAKIIMAKSNLRSMEDIDAKLAHELADCLWSLLVLAAKYNVDLSQKFMETMDELDAKLQKRLAI